MRKNKKISWNNYFMNIASVVSSRSPDPDTKVGCVIVDSNNRIISTGYNGTPSGFPLTEEDWSRPNKYKQIIHAEANAILYAKTDLNNCAIYATLQPCLECTKMICASGIKKIYYGIERPDKDSLKLLKSCGVTITKVPITIKFEII